MRRVLVACVGLLLGALAAAQQPLTAADVMPTRAAGELDISIAPFDPGIPADLARQRELEVFPRIREIEAKFLPFVLRETLADGNGWGAVRVTPEPDAAAELAIAGKILRSDGATMILAIRAVDASGQVWLDRNFSASNNANDEYQALFDEIAQELSATRAALDPAALAAIPDISLLRYATELAPTAFKGYLDRSRDGLYTLQRLPARDDPMVQRINRIRGVEYVITDAVDLKYEELHADIDSVYDVWREHRAKYVEYQQEDLRRARNPSLNAERGSYDALQNLYDNYKWYRMTAQEQDKLAIAFNNEVGPKVDAIETRVAELDGWVQDKYAEWHRLLEELFDAETAVEFQ